MGKTFYLGKDGKQFGPFTEQDLERMQQDGTLQAYVWLWDSTLNAWQPIQAPPPMPEATASGTESELIAHSFKFAEEPPAAAKEEAAEEPAAEADGAKNPPIEVLCFNRKHFVPSKRIHASENSWQLRSRQQIRGRSPFECRSEIKLMIYSHERNESEIATGQIVAAQKQNGFWFYEIEFPADPARPGEKILPKIA